jgi:deazaflavin-dependent oxidoreductase (nitroreductase family)
MSDEPVTMTEIEETRLDWTAQHRQDYLRSGGTKGHVVDVREIGGLRFTTCLLLKTIGRKSGEARILPLIYGDTGGEVVIVASKGGADVHPAWDLNLRGQKEVEFQIGAQAFRGTWREPQGAERAEIWAFMEKLYPPYVDYRKATEREIPLVVMAAGEEIPVFKE